MDNSTKHGVTAIVEYEYIAKEPDEIDLIKGSIITNIKKQPGGWWLGTLASNCKTGMFPDNFVRVLDNNDEKSSVVLRSKSETVHRKCKVVYSYTQNNEDELTLAVGDVIEVLGVVEEGWWRGKLNDKIGVFPSNFVVPVEQSPVLANRRSYNASVLAAAVLAPNSFKNENRPCQDSSNENLLIGSGISSNISGKINKVIKDKEKDVPLLPPKPTRELCRVMFPYEPQNEDELELQVDDIIQIQSKELPDKGWWRGELKGKVGVFPDNFVTLIPSDVSPNKDFNSSGTHSDRPPSGNSTNPSKMFNKKSGSGSSTQSLSNRKDSFGSRDSLNDILSETGLQTGNVAAQRKSLESKNFDLTNNAAVMAAGALSGSGSLADANNLTSSTASVRKSRKGMDSSNKNCDTRKSLENIDEKKTPPPVLGKKPIVPVKKSTSVTSVAGNILSGIKHKVKCVEQKLTIHDVADGIVTSKIGQQTSELVEKTVSLERVSISKDGFGGVEFDNVERSSMLGDMRASRVKAPKRRPPSSSINIIAESNNDSPVYLNGNSSYEDQYENDKSDISSTLNSTESIEIEESEELVKPKPREWDKIKAPWMAELKASQEKKKTSPNIEPRPVDRTSKINELESRALMFEKSDNASTTKLVHSNVQRKSTEVPYTTLSADMKKEISSSNIATSVLSTITSNFNADVTKSVSTLKTSISQDDDIKLRPNSLSISNRSTSPSGRISLNKGHSTDVQSTRVNSATSLTLSSVVPYNNNNHNQFCLSPQQSSTVSSTNSIPSVTINPSLIPSSTSTTAASTTIIQNSILPVDQDNVCPRVVELEQRINKLESIVHSQSKIIENLVKSLREETDKVKGLKTELDKYAQCVTQV